MIVRVAKFVRSLWIYVSYLYLKKVSLVLIANLAQLKYNRLYFFFWAVIFKIASYNSNILHL